jgi:hypothetical protein
VFRIVRDPSTEVASEKNSTLIFPLPIELLRPFLGDK